MVGALMGEHTSLAIDDLADRIVQALARRAEQDTGLTVDEVQHLLVLRVRADAERAGVSPRTLMGAVWRSWERHQRPPMLGTGESYRIIDSLVEKGILTREDQAGDTPVIKWAGLTQDEVQEKYAGLSHEERLFVQGVLRYLARASSAGAG
jgi:hypothetical protein